MFRPPAFEAFIAPASRYPAIWRIIVGALSGVAIYIAGTMLVLFMGLPILSKVFPDLEGMSAMRLMTESGSTPGQMALIFATFIPMSLAAFAMAAWHWRGPASLFGPSAGFLRMFFIAVGVVVGVNFISFIIGLFTTSFEYSDNLALGEWSRHLLWAVPLLIIQITSEELIFRGYFQQQLAVRFKSPLIWMLLPSVMFGMLHFNSEVAPSLAWITVLATTVFGIVAADLTRLTGSLAAAMGLHFANNFFAILIVGMPGELSGISLYHAPFTMDDTQLVSLLIGLDMAVLIVIWLVARRALR